MNEPWNTEKTFLTYDEAAELKNTLQESTRGATLQLKIRRCEDHNGKQYFALRSRTEPSLLQAVKEVEEKLASKSKKTKG